MPPTLRRTLSLILAVVAVLAVLMWARSFTRYEGISLGSVQFVSFRHRLTLALLSEPENAYVFSWHRKFEWTEPPRGFGFRSSGYSTDFTVPYWIIVVAIAFLPVYDLVAWRRRRRRNGFPVVTAEA